MAKEPYEKPEVTTIDLGNLIDEAEKEAASLVAEVGDLRKRIEDQLGDLAYLTAEVAGAHVQLDRIKKKQLVAQTIIELQDKVREGQPPESS